VICLATGGAHHEHRALGDVQYARHAPMNQPPRPERPWVPIIATSAPGSCDQPCRDGARPRREPAPGAPPSSVAVPVREGRWQRQDVQHQQSGAVVLRELAGGVERARGARPRDPSHTRSSASHCLSQHRLAAARQASDPHRAAHAFPRTPPVLRTISLTCRLCTRRPSMIIQTH
jgi:hypothetical protein